MRDMLAAVLVLLLAAPVAAQERNPFALSTPDARRLAAEISNATVAANIGLAVLHDLTGLRPGRDLLHTSCAVALSQGTSLVAKLLVQRTRPDGSDHYSFFSGHSATAAAVVPREGWQIGVGWTLAGATGLGRMAANKHFPSDVAVGLLDGWLSSKLCGRLIGE